MSDAQDRAFMDCAIEAGRQARYWSAPNPPVGCVLVRDGQILGSGFTQPDGDAHAEIMALRAIERANSATAYVTLEVIVSVTTISSSSDPLIFSIALPDKMG